MIVTMEYRIKTVEGKMLMVSEPGRPLVIQIGQGVFPEKIEEQLLSMEQGESFEFILSPQEGYGEKKDFLIQTISKDLFPTDVDLSPETMVELSTANGPVMVKIVTINEQDILVDANHPWAGMTIVFFAKLLERKKTVAVHSCSHGQSGQCCGGHDHGGSNGNSGCGCH